MATEIWMNYVMHEAFFLTIIWVQREHCIPKNPMSCLRIFSRLEMTYFSIASVHRIDYISPLFRRAIKVLVNIWIPLSAQISAQNVSWLELLRQTRPHSHNGDTDIPQSVRLINGIKRALKSPIFINIQDFSYSSALLGVQAEPSPMSFLNVLKYVLCKPNLVSLIYSRKLAILYAINVLLSTLPTIMNSSLQIRR